MPSQTHPRKVGLILSGGGARAAYQVGVIRAIANLLPANTHNPFHVITGTSAGALNAVALATQAQRLRTGVRTLEYVWRNIQSQQIYTLNSGTLLGSASSWALAFIGRQRSEQPASLLNNAPLSALLQRTLKLDRIQRHIDTGFLDAICVTASCYSTGESVSFYQALKGISDWSGPHRVGRRTRLTFTHLLASAAIPTIFPAVQIDTQFFGDGSIRQLAPTSTALHLGAEKLLAIGVSATRSPRAAVPGAVRHPSMSQIIGHILNSAFVDTLENDLDFLRHINEIVPYVPERILRKRDLRHRVIELLEISPSQDLDMLAAQHFDELPRAMKLFIREASSSTLLSLLLFESGYCNTLMKLGFEDAMAKADAIKAFFEVEETGPA